MIDYLLKNNQKIIRWTTQHIEIVFVTLVLSLIITSIIIVITSLFPKFKPVIKGVFSMVYAIPSLAFFALMIPLTGLGKTTTILVLTMYNQTILLNNIINGFDTIEPPIVEAARGMGMSKLQLLAKILIPLSMSSIFTGIRLAVVSSVGITVIGASINAGGLGTLLFEGLRTQNTVKLLWGTILTSLLVIFFNWLFKRVEIMLKKQQIS